MNILLIINGSDTKYTSRVNLSAFNKIYIRPTQYLTWTQVALEAKRLELLLELLFTELALELELYSFDPAVILLSAEALPLAKPKLHSMTSRSVSSHTSDP